MKKSYLLKSVFICCFVVLGGWMIDNFLISEAKTQVQLSDDSYNCQGCKCGRPYEADSCVHGDVGICCSMIQALEDEQLETNFGNYVIDDNLKDLDLLGDPISLSFEIQCVDAAGNKIDESNCNPTTKPTSCDIPDVTPTDKYYTVKFDCNEGSNPPIDQSFKVGESKALNANTCTRTDYAFQGWSKTKGGTKAYDDKATVNLGGTAGATITLYAVWQQIEQQIDKTYTVEYDCNGGSGTPPESQTFTVGQAGTLNANTCTRTGLWKFQGWSTAKLGDKEYNDKATVDLGGTANSTITLYAIWKREINLDPDLDKCSVGCFYVESEDKCYKNSCFIAGTKVIMADGSEKNIEDINKGDMVLGANGEYNTVQGLHMPKLGSKKLWSINGGKNFFTEEHPFMTTEGWKAINSELAMQEVDLEIGELQVGDVLVTNNGYVVIKSLDGVEGDNDTQLYNLMLDGDHTYYADDYLVHNKVKPYAYAEGVGCLGNAEMRGDGCCPLNTWGKGNECVPLCDEDDEPTPSTTTYHWRCVTDPSYDGAACYKKSLTVSSQVKTFYENACVSVNCSTWVPKNQNACEKVTVCKQHGGGSSYIPCAWNAAGEYSENMTYSELLNSSEVRCCVWSTRHAVCKDENGNIVSNNKCTGTKPTDEQCVQQQDIMLNI